MKKLFFCSLFSLASLPLLAQKTPPKPLYPIPTKQQWKWQQLEKYMFIHFGPNTYTNMEWGTGKENPAVFNPTELDCNQWASIAKAAGMKGIIITAKHHDGFCLWPSKYSTHTVRESPWKNGKGDVLKELSDACKKYGLKFGVYLSPWDQNHPSYGTPEYNQIFANTLTEVLTSYGEVFEQWFDGAHGEGPNGKKQVYDFDLFNATVYKHQPNAIIFSDLGPGCRWMGNERGIMGETNWSKVTISDFPEGKKASNQFLNTGDKNGKNWLPAEADVSIRPGWFYSPATDNKVKSLNHLMDIYYKSVGRNATLLLNVPVDRRGLIHANDSARLIEFHNKVQEVFAHNLLKGATVKASNTRHAKFNAKKMLDASIETYWATADNIDTASFEITLPKKQVFNRFLIQEYIPLGQRVEKFALYYWNEKNNAWELLQRATTIGYKRILSFPTLEAKKLKIVIEAALASPTINNIGLYYDREALAPPMLKRNKDGMVSMATSVANADIYYTIDGKEPSKAAMKYTAPFLLKNKATVRAKVIARNSNAQSIVTVKEWEVAPTKWLVNVAFMQGIDANDETAVVADKAQPIEVDLGENLAVKGFYLLPNPSTEANNIARYNFYVASEEGRWEKVLSNEIFNNIKNNPILQKVQFDKIYNNVRYIKLEVAETVTNSKDYIFNELGVITK